MRLAMLDDGTVVELPKRRRMNVGNTRALRRAMRRTDGFVRLAKRALKGSKWKIVTASSGRRSTPRVQVTESGPGSVTVRR